MVPPVYYTRSGKVTVAYQVIGDGPVDLVVGLPSISHLEAAWERPELARLFDRVQRQQKTAATASSSCDRDRPTSTF